MNKNKKRLWLKRLVLALLMPIGLFILSTLMMMALGRDTSSALADHLSAIWLPLTCFRLGLYTLLAYWLAPILLRRQCELYTEEVQFLEQLRKFAQADGEIDDELQFAYDDAVKKLRAYKQLLQQRHYMLMLCIVFDVITIQLPFWVR